MRNHLLSNISALYKPFIIPLIDTYSNIMPNGASRSCYLLSLVLSNSYMIKKGSLTSRSKFAKNVGFLWIKKNLGNINANSRNATYAIRSLEAKTW